MGNSLRDQLLKAGLVDEKKLRQSRQAKKKNATGRVPPSQPSAAENTRAEQAARSREMNRKRQEAAERKALAAQIRQIILESRISRDDSVDQVHHFQHGDRVRSIHVTSDQRDALVRGRLGIVTLSGGYELLPREAMEKVRERDESRVVLLNGSDTRESPNMSGPEDPYAGYEIPDDLMW